MIDVSDSQIVVQRSTSDGRFLLFTSTDHQYNSRLPWVAVVADICGDGAGFRVRLDEAVDHAGFTLLDLLRTADQRAVEEADRRPAPFADRINLLVRHAIKREAQRRHDPICDGLVWQWAEPTATLPYRLAEARARDDAVPLCRHPAGLSEGVTLEQLLIIAQQLCRDAEVNSCDATYLTLSATYLTEAVEVEARRTALLLEELR